MSKYIDLRSDTVTLPTQEMYDAMSIAEVGDDVQMEDPTTNKLQEYAAELLGKEAALLVPSGTMGNLVAILTHTPLRKPEIIAERSAHIVTSEACGYAHLAGTGLRTINGNMGAFDPDKVEGLIRDPENIHHPRTALICMENTHNAAGGTVVGLDNIERVHKVARKYGIPMHLDGARIFNAAHALNVTAKEIAQYFDSVQICLSKGLSAPVGSLILGTSDFIKQANAMRKMVGGGMRQCGVIAAAGYVALTKMTDRLSEDHETAKIIGYGLYELPGICLDINTVQSNMVRIDTSNWGVTAYDFVGRLKTNGVLAGAMGKYTVRFVTHRHISKEDAYRAVKIIDTVVKEL
jgi:threonine aldolase